MFEQLANTVANVAEQRLHVGWMQCQRDLDSQTFRAPHETSLFFVEMKPVQKAMCERATIRDAMPIKASPENKA
jgi:hypothetical protein